LLAPKFPERSAPQILTSLAPDLTAVQIAGLTKLNPNPPNALLDMPIVKKQIVFSSEKA
jgi:hypothetical protein